MDARHETAWMRSGCQTDSPFRRPTPRPTALRRAALFRASLLTALAFGLGCRGGVNTDLLVRDLRLQEDRIYELEDHLDDCHAVVQTYQQENARLRKRLSAFDPDDSTAADEPTVNRRPSDETTQPTWPDEPSRETDDGPPDGLPDDVPVDVIPPVIEEGTDNQSSSGFSPDRSAPPEFDPPKAADDVTPLSPKDSRLPVEETGRREIERATEELPAPTTLNSSAPIDRIVLHRLLAPPESRASGELTLRAVIEPRSSAGRPVRVAGDVSLMILDPSQPESTRRVARWDYSETETADEWRQTGLGSGLHFELPLPATVRDGTYELWARWVTPQGEKLLESVEFEVNRRALAARSRSEWSPYR